MTLVELMIVVVIIGILSSLGMVGFRRYVGRARATEAVAMLAEMSSKELVYFSEFAQYLPLNSGAAIAATLSGASAAETAAMFWPRDPTGATFDSVRSAVTVAAPPQSWVYAAVRPKDTVLYCTYFAGAGQAGSTPPTSTATAIGGALLGVAAITQPWFYVLGSCNLRGSGAQVYPGGVTTFAITYNSPSLTVLNDGQ